MQTMKKSVARILVLAMAICLMVSLAVPAAATEMNQSVTDAKSAVVQIQIWYVDANAAMEMHLQNGTGFLINEDTVVTNQHVVTAFTDEWYRDMARLTNALYGLERTAEDLKNNLELRISVLRDVHVKATVRTASTEMDYAILTLNDKIYNRSTLPLRSSSSLKQTETVYALGFPGDIDNITDQSVYTADDVTITSGTVNKVDRFSFQTTEEGQDEEGNPVIYITGEYNNVDCVESSALIAGGNSGGPLVDANGAVVGINTASSATRNLAVASDQLIETLEALGIDYETADAAPAATEPAPTEAPTEAPTQATEAPVVTEAPTQATEAPTQATEAPVAEKEEGGMNTILIVAAIAVVAVIVIIVIVMSKGKKKAPAAPAAPAYTAPTGGFTAPTYTAPMGAGETTVLGGDAGETTILSRSAIHP